MLLFDFINLTQVHNFTVSAQDSLPSFHFGLYRKFYRNFASTNADNETYCTIPLTSQVVMVQSLQPKGREFESMCVLFFYLYSIRLISCSIDVPRPLGNEILDHSTSKGWCVTRKMSQSVQNIFRDSREKEFSII